MFADWLLTVNWASLKREVDTCSSPTLSRIWVTGAVSEGDECVWSAGF